MILSRVAERMRKSTLVVMGLLLFVSFLDADVSYQFTGSVQASSDIAILNVRSGLSLLKVDFSSVKGKKHGEFAIPPGLHRITLSAITSQGVNIYQGTPITLTYMFEAGRTYGLKTEIQLVNRGTWNAQIVDIREANESANADSLRLYKLGEKQISSLDETMIPVQGSSFLLHSRNLKKPQSTDVHSFHILKHEVTQAMWVFIMNHYDRAWVKGNNLPATYVSWDTAFEFCNKLSVMEGLTPCYKGSGKKAICDFSANGYRLPTEAEWEYAASGGNQGHGYEFSGSDTLDVVAWNLDNSGKTAHDVMTKRPNELGLYDMSGNVSEICWDQTPHPKYVNGFHRISRGGRYWGSPSECRLSCSYADQINIVSEDRGFRIVRNKE